MKKKQLIDIFTKYQDTVYSRGSCGELGDSFNAIDADLFDDIINEIINIDANESDFDKAVEPAIRYLFKNHHPHTKIYIDYDKAELLKGEMCHNLTDEVPD